MLNFIQNIKEKNPMIHCITNYVTINDVANILIACGASPIMSDYSKECEELTSISDGLVINLGNIYPDVVEAMKISLKSANTNNIVSVFDPVAIGATKPRKKIAFELLKEGKFSVIRGNISEIKNLVGLNTKSKGVDASKSDAKDSLEDKVEIAKTLSRNTGSVVVISGAKDIITNGDISYICENGDEMMKNITGSGCILTALIAAFIASNNNILEATLMAVITSGVAGEFAKNMLNNRGNLTFRENFIDEIFLMNDDKISKFAKFYEI
ncbi:hydroxyethylthiazole kinase [Campylobacter blaseri]|uniref:Hydroxyethylthiazole kinase n=1 Tax=Campylobacter blaseri TaxID=2042961 RepID=A0A2P8QZI1_9BACT|nr:hydroxyethylthiazole kinase [Campylobacter blaseri]PSM51649.1 hydroxyethylthiazole kinase [Campylobacter blaseri]PSM53442.1 hydroxyethylthiazole kinase [Campylobacter blaseri]QKF86738.1 hydroxyethylthiazole kinase [Campylobacter blaseri]